MGHRRERAADVIGALGGDGLDRGAVPVGVDARLPDRGHQCAQPAVALGHLAFRQCLARALTQSTCHTARRRTDQPS